MVKRPARRLDVEIAPGIVLARLPDGRSVVEVYDDARDVAEIDRVQLAAWFAATATSADATAAVAAAGRIDLGTLVGAAEKIGRKLGQRGS